MSGSRCLGLGALLLALVLSLPILPTRAQGLRTVVESRDKVFPGVAAGVMAIKRDSAGRYYILSKPATSISVFSADGTPAGQIPNAKSNTGIRYAVDIDVNAEGFLVVADRGSNAIEVFSPDGSLVSRTPVAAPTSVVALPDGTFAVTSLTSKRLVEVLDLRGKVLRSFGDPSDVGDPPPPSQNQPAPPKQSLNDLGRISGDSAGGIYFAFTSIPDPTLRKYDRYGYLGYETSLPEKMFVAGDTRPIDRVQLTFGVSDATLEEQTSGFVTFGSSSDVQFGAGLGTGLGQALRRGGYSAALQQQQGTQQGGGPFGAMFSGDVTDQGANFQLGMGRMSGMGGRGRRFNSGAVGDQTTNQGAVLQFGGNDDSTSADVTTQSSGTTADLGIFATPDFGASNSYNSTSGVQNLGLGGLPAPFLLGSTINQFGFRPRNFENGPLGSTGTTGATGTGTAAGPAGHTPGSAGARGAAGGGAHSQYHGGHYRNNAAFTTTFKVNLGDLGRISASDKPVITAMAVDPETQEIWAGIGDTLVHFSKDGNPAGIYYLMMTGSTALKPAALLVERDRILIASDTWGIFAFPRPDKPATAAQPQLNVTPQVVRQQ